jgi:ATP-dependent Clp protease ATP-binding subunit ClpA
LFEKFTEKAINVVCESQNIARAMNSAAIVSEHLLLALVKCAKGICLKIFNSYGVEYDRLYSKILMKKSFDGYEKTMEPIFSTHYKDILKNSLDLANKSGNSTVLYEHLFLAILNDKNSDVINYLKEFDFDIGKACQLLEKLVQRKIRVMYHPEIEDAKEKETDKTKETDMLFDSEEAKSVFERAVSKLSASNYEILGTEQIISSILEDKSSELSKIMADYGITDEVFNSALSQVQSRQAEYEGRQIIFTPNAFLTMNLALQTAKELGSSVLRPEHIVLGLLKAKKGIAYDIINSLNVHQTDLAHSIIKPIEKQMPETLTILRLAKEETRRLGKSVVGTEMFLLGIIGEGAGIGANVLESLEITIKDARIIIENMIGYGNEYFDKEIVFTKRAKRVLELAWELAKNENKDKIESDHLLLAITKVPDCSAMKALEQLGVDELEIKEGIKKYKNA